MPDVIVDPATADATVAPAVEASSSAAGAASSAAPAATPSHGMARSAPTPKSSTTSTLFLTSTLSVPNNDEICLGVATVLHCQLLQDFEAGRSCPKPFEAAALMFNEDAYRDRPTEQPAVTPIEDFYAFIKRAFELAQFSPECNILSLIFVNRCVAFTKMPVTAHTWRLLMLSALLVAQKVWDDRALANVDFPTVYATAAGTRDIGSVDVKVINRLERKFLELLGYNVSVSSSLYAKYYFELRTLAEENNMAWRLAPLTAEQARALEVTSSKKRDEFRSTGASDMPARAHTMADLHTASASAGPSSKTRAVLS